MSDGGLVSRSPRVAWVDSGDRVMIVRLDDVTSEPIALEDSAATVWRALGDGLTVTALVSGIADDYGLPVETVGADIRSFLDQLVATGLVVRMTDAPSTG